MRRDASRRAAAADARFAIARAVHAAIYGETSLFREGAHSRVSRRNSAVGSLLLTG